MRKATNKLLIRIRDKLLKEARTSNDISNKTDYVNGVLDMHNELIVELDALLAGR